MHNKMIVLNNVNFILVDNIVGMKLKVLMVEEVVDMPVTALDGELVVDLSCLSCILMWSECDRCHQVVEDCPGQVDWCQD